MIGVAAVAVLWRRENSRGATADNQSVESYQALLLPTLESPFSPTAAFKFGVIFLALRSAGTLAQLGLGEAYFTPCARWAAWYLARARSLGGKSAAAGTLPSQGAANGAVIASAMSVIVNLPLVARVARVRGLTLRTAGVWGAIVLLGALGCILQIL